MKANTKNITLCALFAAFLAASAQICIPLPSGVALTLQTFAVALCGAVLGVKKGLVTTAVYIFTGLIGMPIFSSFTSGIAALSGATGGFIIGFLPLSIFCAVWKNGEKTLISVLKAAAGLVLCYLFGAVWFSVITGCAIAEAFVVSCAPYVIKDAVFIGAALSLGKTLRKRICF